MIVEAMEKSPSSLLFFSERRIQEEGRTVRNTVQPLLLVVIQ